MPFLQTSLYFSMLVESWEQITTPFVFEWSFLFCISGHMLWYHSTKVLSSVDYQLGILRSLFWGYLIGQWDCGFEF